MNSVNEMKLKSGLGALYAIWSGNGSGLFYISRPRPASHVIASDACRRPSKGDVVIPRLLTNPKKVAN